MTDSPNNNNGVAAAGIDALIDNGTDLVGRGHHHPPPKKRKKRKFDSQFQGSLNPRFTRLIAQRGFGRKGGDHGSDCR